MLKTNSRKAAENIRKYIAENCTFYNYDVEKPETFPEIARLILKTCNEEKFYRVYKSRYEQFKDWCQGLPSFFDTCYYYDRSAVDDLAEILEETKEEASRFTEEKAAEKLTYLIYRELVKGASE